MAKNRTLSAKWSREAAADIAAMHNVEMEFDFEYYNYDQQNIVEKINEYFQQGVADSALWNIIESHNITKYAVAAYGSREVCEHFDLFDNLEKTSALRNILRKRFGDKAVGK